MTHVRYIIEWETIWPGDTRAYCTGSESQSVTQSTTTSTHTFCILKPSNIGSQFFNLAVRQRSMIKVPTIDRRSQCLMYVFPASLQAFQ